jgi:hypothetical protein
MGEGQVGLPGVLLRGVEKAIGMQQSPVAGYVARLRRACPDATPAEVIAVLEKRYLAVVTGVGAAVGGVAAAPVLGTVLAGALSGGETVVFLQATTFFALAVAEVHGIGGMRLSDVGRWCLRLLLVTMVPCWWRRSLAERVSTGRSCCPR